MKFNFLAKFIHRCLMYAICIVSILEVQSRIQPEKKVDNLFHPWLRERSFLKLQKLQVKSPASYFLGERPHEPKEFQKYVGSGTAHLLALSSGQLSPFLSVIQVLVPLLFFPALCFLRMDKAFKIIRVSQELFITLFSLFLSLLLNMPGALLRLTFLSPHHSHSLLNKSFFVSFRFLGMSYSAHVFLLRIILLLILCFGIKMEIQNVSFLLSSLGASACTYVSLNLKKNEMESFKDKIVTALISIVLTSTFINSLMFIFQKNSFLNVTTANILALPLVNLVITPASILYFLCPVDSLFENIFKFMFETSCSAMRWIAENLSDMQVESNHLASKAIFSNPAIVWLLIWNIVLWVILDMYNLKTFRQLQLASATVPLLK